MRPAAIIAAALALAACQRSPRKTSEDTAVPPTMPSAPTTGLLPTDAPAFVGRILLNDARSETEPGEYCVDGTLYRGAAARLQRTNVFGVDIDPSFDRTIALVHGTREPSLWSALTKVGPCPDEPSMPAAQMRSDWLADEGGFKTSQKRLEAAPFIRATAIQKLELHEVIARTDDAVTVRIRNPFASAITGELASHYEGGPGKPMPHYEKQPLTIPAGEHVDLVVPRIWDGAPPRPAGGLPSRPHRLETLELTATAGRIELTLTIGGLRK